MTGEISITPSEQGVSIVQFEGQTFVAIPPELLTTDTLGISTVQEMEKEMPPPGIPGLELPGYILIDVETFMGLGPVAGVTQVGKDYVIDSKEFALSLANFSHEIMMGILDKWGESIKKQDKERKEHFIEEQKKTVYEETREFQESYDYKSQLDISDKVQEMADRVNTGRVGAMDNYANRIKSGNATELAFVMGSLAVGATFTGDFIKMSATGVIPPTDPSVGLAMKTVQDVGGSKLVGSALGYMGAAFMVGASIPTRLSSSQAAPKEVNIKDAQNYAKRTLDMLKEGSDVSSILNGLSDGDKELVAMAKVTMAALPLVALYTLEGGHPTAQEFKAMLTGEMKGMEGEKEQLIQLIREQMQHIHPESKVALMENLMAYFESKPDVEEMFDSVNVSERITAELKSDLVIG